MAHEISPEQIVSNDVRIALMGGDVPASNEVAGVMRIARIAFKAGEAYRDKPFDDPASFVQNYANSQGERAAQMAEEQLKQDPERSLLIGAYQKGRGSSKPADPMLRQMASEFAIHGPTHDGMHRWGQA